MTVDIRPADPRDTQAILALSQQTMDAHRARLSEKFPEGPLPAEGFLKGLFAGKIKGAAFVAETEGTVLGWTGMQRLTTVSGDNTHDDLGLIIDLTVADEAQRQGIGSALTASLIEAARDQGVTLLYADVWRGSPSGHVLEKAGLTLVRSVHELRLADPRPGLPTSQRLSRLFDRLLPWLTIFLSIIVFYLISKR